MAFLREHNVGVDTVVWGDVWRGESGKGKQVRRRGIPREELAGWVARAQAAGYTTAQDGMQFLHEHHVGVAAGVWGDVWRVVSGADAAG
ncbi:hypothetical protein ACWDKQ_36310, partial [Saccharopolyspora sp. NPDC000995]